MDSKNESDRKTAGDIVSKWCNPDNPGRPYWNEWEMICQKCHLSMDYFLLGKGDGTPTASDLTPNGKFDFFTLRDYCQLLFLDMPQKFGLKWGMKGTTVNGDVTTYEFPLPAIVFWARLPTHYIEGQEIGKGTIGDYYRLNSITALTLATLAHKIAPIYADSSLTDIERQEKIKRILKKIPDDKPLKDIYSD